MTPLHLTQHETVEILDETPDLLLVEVTYHEPGKPPPKHFHPSQDEHFSVLDGRLSTSVAGKERVLEPGETLDIPRGAAHQMWNAGPGPVRARWTTKPAGRTGEWFRALDRVHQGRSGTPPLPVMAALLTDFDDVFRLSTVPPLLLRGLAPLGRKGAREATGS